MSSSESLNRLNELSRRRLLRLSSNSLAGAAFAWLCQRDSIASGLSTVENESSPTGHHSPKGHLREFHHVPKAKRVIHLCLCGGYSHLDSFDYKPSLKSFHGKSLETSDRPVTFFDQIGLIRKNDWEFKQRGESGLWISELFPNIATVADDLTIINSMVAESANHTPATFEENTGFRQNGFPVMGSWISYGLGTETEELPSYVVLPDQRGMPAGGTINWSNGFLPAQHQGVAFQNSGPAVPDLNPTSEVDPHAQRESLKLLQQLNQDFGATNGFDDSMIARMKAYELAGRMQTAIPDVVEIDQESQTTLDMYGVGKEPTNDFGRRCLLARRLLEKGVRFVQLFSGGAFGSPRINWDGHEDVVENHTREAQRIDQPVAGLIRDLKQRGMLEDTLVLFTTEFGRTPFTQSASTEVGTGRDHNMLGFSVWMAGAGLRPGMTFGSTDEIGWKAVENPLHWYDFHATVLHLLGVDHTKLTYYHNGIERRLTNVHGDVIRGILS